MSSFRIVPGFNVFKNRYNCLFLSHKQNGKSILFLCFWKSFRPLHYPSSFLYGSCFEWPADFYWVHSVLHRHIVCHGLNEKSANLSLVFSVKPSSMRMLLFQMLLMWTDGPSDYFSVKRVDDNCQMPPNLQWSWYS